MAIDLKLIDKLLADYKDPEDIIGENALLKQLTKAGHNSGNSRNGATTKTLKGDFGELPLETPPDRNASYEPKIIGKNQTRFNAEEARHLDQYGLPRTRARHVFIERLWRSLKYNVIYPGDFATGCSRRESPAPILHLRSWSRIFS